MQQTKSTTVQTMRRLGMVLGFIVFIFFAYKASHDVSSTKIAAGAKRKDTVSALTTKPAVSTASIVPVAYAPGADISEPKTQADNPSISHTVTASSHSTSVNGNEKNNKSNIAAIIHTAESKPGNKDD